MVPSPHLWQQKMSPKMLANVPLETKWWTNTLDYESRYNLKWFLKFGVCQNNQKKIDQIAPAGPNIGRFWLSRTAVGPHRHFYTKSPGDLDTHTRQRNTIVENMQHVALLLEEHKNRLLVAKASQEVWLGCSTLSRTPEPGRYLCWHIH